MEEKNLVDSEWCIGKTNLAIYTLIKYISRSVYSVIRYCSNKELV
jgi:hypothetical protein